MKSFAIASCYALAACNTYDPGGSVAQREAVVASELKSNAPVRLPFNCDSACTMQLADPDACIQRGSSLGIHAGSVNGVADERTTETIFSYYYRYPKFQADIRARHAMATLQITVYSAAKMHTFGVPYCA